MPRIGNAHYIYRRTGKALAGLAFVPLPPADRLLSRACFALIADTLPPYCHATDSFISRSGRPLSRLARQAEQEISDLALRLRALPLCSFV